MRGVAIRVLARFGITRGFVVRRLVRHYGVNLRELAETPRLQRVSRWLERGAMDVPLGLGAGLLLDLRGIPLTHAHLGMLAWGNVEQSVQEALLRHLGRGGVLYDVGANVGFFALLGARFAGPEGHVYAFEPTPDNAAEVRSNAALNELANITVIEKAVGAEAGTGRLQIVDDQSWSKLVETGEHPFTERIMDVEVVALDDLVRDGLRPPTVVKIDVEGFELAVLEGMRQVLAEHRPVVICELHDTHAEFAAFMREAGYRLVNLEGAESIESAGASAHALALPGLAGD